MPDDQTTAASASGPDHRSGATTRRQALKRAGAVGVHVAWSVPVVQAIGAAPAMAASAPATITGQVTNAATGAAISGAVVSSGTGQTATTNASGTYTLTGVPSGTRTITVTATGFITASQTVTITGASTTTVNFALSQLAQAIRVVLTWGATPADLDLHISGPLSAPQTGRFHCYYNAPRITDSTGDAYCQLDIDDQNGNGPEAQSITVSNAEGDYVAGTYRVWVHNFSGGTAGFSGSGATIRLFDLASQRATYVQSAASGAATQPIWVVAEFDVNDLGVVTAVRPLQTMNAGTQTTVF